MHVGTSVRGNSSREGLYHAPAVGYTARTGRRQREPPRPLIPPGGANGPRGRSAFENPRPLNRTVFPNAAATISDGGCAITVLRVVLIRFFFFCSIRRQLSLVAVTVGRLVARATAVKYAPYRLRPRYLPLLSSSDRPFKFDDGGAAAAAWQSERGPLAEAN